MSDWISVKDKLPKVDERVLCARTQTSMGGTKYITASVGCRWNDLDTKFSCSMDWVTVTHWMPLPKDPTE